MCEAYSEQIHLYIDNELNEAEKQKLEEHLNICQSCRQNYEELTAMIQALKNEPLLELPDNFHQELMTKLKRSKRYSYRQYTQLAAGLAIGFLCISALATVPSFFETEKNMTTVPSSEMEMRTFSADTFEIDTGDNAHQIEFFAEPQKESGISNFQITLDDTIVVESSPQEITVISCTVEVPDAQYIFIGEPAVTTKTYCATIEVDDLDAAVAFIDTLEGVTVPSDSNLFNPKMDLEQGEIGRSVTRTVPHDRYDSAIEQLRQYGTLQLEQESGDVIEDELELAILFIKNTE